MVEFLRNIWAQIVGVASSINIVTSLLDIALVAFLIYALLRLVRDSRAEQLLKGLVVLFIIYLLSSWLNLSALTYILQLLFGNALILLVVVFQPELRRALERVGHSRLHLFGRPGLKDEVDARNRQVISHVCDACEILQRQKMGALIVFERETMLGDIASSGTIIEATSSPELIGNIFFNKAPLHDGALIIRDGRLYAAGCILPLTDNLQLSSELGTRHRAAVGMSENSDAVVVVVSEETGALSVALSGVLRRGYSKESLRQTLENAMIIPESPVNQPRKWLHRQVDQTKGGDQQ